MSRKQYAPSLFRRCAVFLALAGVLALGAGRLRAGVFAGEPSKDWNNSNWQQFTGPGVFQSSSDRPESSSRANAPLESSAATDPANPGISGENWFLGLQQQIASSADSQATEQEVPAQAVKVDPSGAGSNATAIPSLPSFWSGLTCCAALIVVGMFPRVRRVFR